MKHLVLAIFIGTLLQISAQNLPAVMDFAVQPVAHWEFKASSSFYASPIIKDQVVYIGNLDSNLYAINLNDGKEIWRFQTDGAIRSNVCIHMDNLYLNGGDGRLYCLDRKTGKQNWNFKTNGEHQYDFADYFQSTPVLANGMLYFGSGDSTFYAINPDNGTLIWSFKTEGIVHTTPAIDNDKVFFGSFDGYVYALHAETGTLIWKFKTVGHRYFPRGEVQGSPVTFDNLVFIGARDYNVYALDQNKGFCHWNKSFKKGWGLSNSIHDSILYIGCADERRLISVHPASGDENWNQTMEFLIFGQNAYTDSMLYVGTTIGKLHGISIKTGAKVWSFHTESYQNSRSKYFKEDDSYRDDIYSIIKSNEQFLEVECELGGIFSTPRIIDNLILFSSTNGKIYCLKNNT